MRLGCALLLLALLGAALAHKNYNGYKVFRTSPVTVEQAARLAEMQQSTKMDFWSELHVGSPVDIMASPKNVRTLAGALNNIGLQHSVLINDVGTLLDNERIENEMIKTKESRALREVTFDRFMDVDEIMTYIHEVQAANPSIATIDVIATSTEGRGVHGLKISNGPGKRAVWIDCGIHAREWASPPVCMKVIEEVIASTELQDLADWHVLPVGNPDGYAYTWSNDRLWRKTRKPNSGSSCIGVDPNRNFEYMWNANNNNNPCSETYPGTAAYSEPECLGISNRVKELGSNAMLYLTVHSYGQIFYFPYGTTATPAPNNDDMQRAGDIAAAALQAVRGTVYEVYSESSPSGFIYGAMDDFAYDSAGINYSYTMELPGGGGGFVLPPNQIQPVVDESWAGIEAMVRHIAGLSKKQ